MAGVSQRSGAEASLTVKDALWALKECMGMSARSVQNLEGAARAARPGTFPNEFFDLLGRAKKAAANLDSRMSEGAHRFKPDTLRGIEDLARAEVKYGRAIEACDLHPNKAYPSSPGEAVRSMRVLCKPIWSAVEGYDDAATKYSLIVEMVVRLCAGRPFGSVIGEDELVPSSLAVDIAATADMAGRRLLVRAAGAGEGAAAAALRTALLFDRAPEGGVERAQAPDGAVLLMALSPENVLFLRWLAAGFLSRGFRRASLALTLRMREGMTMEELLAYMGAWEDVRDWAGRHGVACSKDMGMGMGASDIRAAPRGARAGDGEKIETEQDADRLGKLGRPDELTKESQRWT